MEFDQSEDLSIREIILGIINSKDISGEKIIHSSDFRASIADHGIPNNSPPVEKILLSCKIDRQGNIHYANAESDIIRERREYNARKKLNLLSVPGSSFGAREIPWRGDIVHKSQVIREQQAKALVEKREELRTVFQKFSEHQISAEQCISMISALGISPTTQFQQLMIKNRSVEVSFSQFLQSLGKYDQTEVTASPRSAGDTRKPENDDSSYSLSTCRRRSGWSKKLEQEVRNQKPKQNGVKKVEYIVTRSGEKKEPPRMSDSMTGLIFSPETDDTSTRLLSHTHRDLLAANSGGEVTVNYTVEQRTQRKQILFALRQLDVGAISQEDLEERIYALGIALPDQLFTLLRKKKQTGSLDWRKCVELLDNTIFKTVALNSQLSEKKVAGLRRRLLAHLLGSGERSLSQVGRIFQEIKQGSGSNSSSPALAFQEYLLGLRFCGVEEADISDEDLRLLFNSSDTSGDGLVDADEFLASLRGPISGARIEAVRNAFKSLDRSDQKSVPASVLFSGFNSAAHPNVLDGSRTEREVLLDLVEGLRIESEEDLVSASLFESYYENLSPQYPEDRVFLAMVRGVWGLSDLLPPPPSVNHPAKGNHGNVILWNQEPSEKEAVRAKPSKKLVKPSVAGSGGDLIRWGRDQDPEVTMEELKGLGMTHTNRSYKLQASSVGQDALSWNPREKGRDKDKEDKSKILQRKKQLAGEAGEGEDPGAGFTVVKIHSPDKLACLPPTAGVVLDSVRKKREDRFTLQPKTWNELKARDLNSGTPFGVDEPEPTSLSPPPPPSPPSPSTGPQPRSLAEHLQQRNRPSQSASLQKTSFSPPRSLADLMRSKRI